MPLTRPAKAQKHDELFFYIVLWKGGIYGSKRKNNRMVIQDGMVVFVFVTLAHRIFFLATNSADLLLASLKVS